MLNGVRFSRLEDVFMARTLQPRAGLLTFQRVTVPVSDAQPPVSGQGLLVQSPSLLLRSLLHLGVLMFYSIDSYTSAIADKLGNYVHPPVVSGVPLGFQTF